MSFVCLFGFYYYCSHIDMALAEPHVVRSTYRAVALAWRQNVCRSSSSAAASLIDEDSHFENNRESMVVERETATVSGMPVGAGNVSVSHLWDNTRQVSQRALSLITEGIVGSSIVLMAAPKRKTTPSRKGMRSSSKYVRFVPVVSECSKCSRIFPPHAMPSKCEEDECPAFPNKKSKDTME